MRTFVPLTNPSFRYPELLIEWAGDIICKIGKIEGARPAPLRDEKFGQKFPKV